MNRRSDKSHLLRHKVISSDGEELLNDIADQIVEEADSLGHDTLMYVTKAVGALAIRDEQNAAKAIQSLLGILQGGNKQGGDDKGDSSSSKVESGVTHVLESLRSNIVETLPEPVRIGSQPRLHSVLKFPAIDSFFLVFSVQKTPAMQRTWKLGLLLGSKGASSLTSSKTNAAADAAQTITKFVPLIRKLSQEPRVTNKANEVIARLGERMASRALRAAFGLPAPVFEAVHEAASSAESNGVKISVSQVQRRPVQSQPMIN
jgi:hypothetical protein